MGFYKSFRIANILTNLFSSKNIAKIVLFGVILLIIGILFSNNVLATDQEISLSYLEGSQISSNHVVEHEDSLVFYFKTEPGYVYHITNNSDSNWSIFYSSNELSIGSDVTYITGVNVSNTYDFVGNGEYFICWNDNENNTSNLSVTTTYTKDMSGTTADLVDVLSPNNLWVQFGFAIPLIGVAVLFAIGLIIVKKLTKGTSKGKVKF